jgi:MFS family permease
MPAEISTSPGPTAKLSFPDFIKLNIFGFAINILWNPMSTVILPILVLHFADESRKSTYLGLITLAGIILAIIVQPIAGSFSDNSSLRWGKRRPFILAGSVLLVITLAFIGIIDNLAMLFVVYCLLQVASNIANGPWNGLIPDLVPMNKRGMAAGIKGTMEILGAIFGIQVIGYIMSERLQWEAGSKLFLSLGIIAAIFMTCMLVTVIGVKEKPAAPGPSVKSQLASLLKIFHIGRSRRRDFIYYLVSRLLFMMPLFVLRTFGLYLFKDVTDVKDPVATIANLTVVLGICLVIAVVPMGYVADRIGRRPIIALSALTGIAGFLVLLFSRSELPIMIGGGLIGLANGAFMSASWALATDLCEKGQEARYLGLTNLATGGASLVATFAGPVMDLFYNLGMPRTGYQIVLSVCIGLFILSAFLVYRIRTR